MQTDIAAHSDNKLHVIFNAIVLAASILTMLFIIVAWNILDSSVVLSYILSTIISLLVFHQLKIGLLKSDSSHTETIETDFPPNSGKRNTILLFVSIVLILVIPLIILLILPRFWLMILNGIVAGATISELLLYIQKIK